METLGERITTPFKVEFARQSQTRKGAPTLVPVEVGGARVPARIFVLNVAEDEAANRLWRRETDSVGSGKVYTPSPKPGPKTVIVERLENFHAIDLVLYTRIRPNIEPLTAQELARLAIESAQALDNDRDGVSYLIAAKRNGITTPLSDAYEEALLKETGTRDLTSVLNSIRAARKPSMPERPR